MIKKLRRKFIIVATCVVIGVIGGILGIINIVNYIKINEDADKILNVLSNNNGTMPLPNFDDKEGMLPSLPRETPFQTRYFTVKVHDGQISDVNISMIFRLSEEEAKQQTISVIDSGKSSGYCGDFKYVKTTVDGDDLYIFLYCAREIYTANFFLKTSIIIGLAAILLIFVLIWALSSIVIKPVAESYSKQKRFITDANHEIKTPLSIIGATNEVIELKYGENEWSNTINNQVKKLTTLTEKLVFLSRMDEENTRIPMTEYDLSQTVAEVSEQFKSMAQISEKTFNISIQPNITGFGDVSVMGQLVSILLENAFKYSNKKGTIDIFLTANGKHNKIVVGNSTDGVDKKNLNKLFDRFYRSDNSRNSETGGN